MIEVRGNKSLFSSLCEKIPGIPEGAAFSLQSMEGHQVVPSFYNGIERTKILMEFLHVLDSLPPTCPVAGDGGPKGLCEWPGIG